MTLNESRPLAVVTGASSGIGYELAKIFAENGFDLMLAAEDDQLEEVQRELSRVATVDSVQVDLASEEGVEELYHYIRTATRPVEALALTTGVGAGDEPRRAGEVEKELDLIDLNVRATVHLCNLVVNEMVQRNRGKILFTSATLAAAMPATYQVIYEASKSFLRSFAEAVRTELRGTAVSVTTIDDDDDPAVVAKQSFEALMADREEVAPV